MQPLDQGLNAAILFITSRLIPNGYLAADDAPSTFEALVSQFDAGNMMVVYSGRSDHTIYGDAAVNHAFRAWHDWCHWKGTFPLSPDGEAEACQMQCDQLYDLYGLNAHTLRWASIIKAEVIGQAIYFERHGRFPGNQRLFIQHYLANPEIAFINPAL